MAKYLDPKALELVEESAYSDAELYAIDKYWDQISRERTRENAAEKRGLERGRAEGRAEGEARERQKNALKMKQKGFAIVDIAEITGLSVEEIDAL